MTLTLGLRRYGVVLALAGSLANTWAATTFPEVKAAYRSSDTLFVDRHGEVLQRLRTDFTVRRGQWVALQDVSPALRTALVLSEDKRFYEHSGVDWRAVSAAAWGNLWNSKTRGASTITMQLAGLLDEDLKRGSSGRSVVQKVQQTISASLLEQNWRKDHILEAYLNLVPFRGELVGIDAMSQTLFGKSANGLDYRESALAAALVRAPNAKLPQVIQRTCSVMKSLERNPDYRCDDLDLFVSGSLNNKNFAPSEGMAAHAAYQALKGTTAARHKVQTTLNAPLQRFAVQTLQNHLRELTQRHVEDGALVVLDNATGEVLAWVGSSGALSSTPDVDGVTALRQPGSTLKPFLYAQAIAEKRMTAASLLEDSAAQIQTASGLYIPQNYDRQFKGWVSARTALGSSLNVPAVRTLVMVSPEAFEKQLRAIGLPLQQHGDFYGYSLALGSAEVSLLHLTNAYRTLANGGMVSATKLIPTPTAPKPKGASALDPRAAFIVGNILSDPMARALTFGLDSVLNTRFWTAVKTGTSKDMRDNWAVGYSQHYTVGVWVGNSSGAPMWDVSGTTGAAPIWAAVMRYLHTQKPSRAPMAPAGVVAQQVSFDTEAGSPAEASRTEWFIAGTEQSAITFSKQSNQKQKNRAPNTEAIARINSPTHGTIIALDPDIPPAAQVLSLQAEGSQLTWLLNGKVLARGNSATWRPWPGKHTLQIRNSHQKILDEVRLEVRGAGVVKR